MNSENCTRAPTPENMTAKRPRTSPTLQTPRRSAKRARRYVSMQQNIQLKSIIFASAYIVSYLLCHPWKMLRVATIFRHATVHIYTGCKLVGYLPPACHLLATCILGFNTMRLSNNLVYVLSFSSHGTFTGWDMPGHGDVNGTWPCGNCFHTIAQGHTSQGVVDVVGCRILMCSEQFW